MDPVVKFVHNNCIKLRSRGMTFEDIFNIGFDAPEKIMAEADEGEGFASFTYGEVKAMCDKTADALAARLGYTDRFVGLNAENCVGWIVLFWAILKSGNKPYLINTVQPKSFTKSIIDTLGVDTVLYVGSAPGLTNDEISYDILKNAPAATCDTAPAFCNEIALTTSGTTLQEKICIYSGREISEQILNCEEILRLNPDMRKFYHGSLKMLMLLPLYHIFGLEATFLWFVFFGVTFVFLPSKEPTAMLETIKGRGVTHVFAVPLFWRTVEKAVLRELKTRSDQERSKFDKARELSIKLQKLSAPLGRAFTRRAFKQIRGRLFGDGISFCISGGSYLNNSTLELMNALGYPLCNGYGMSEIGVTSVELSRKVADRLKNSIGKPFGSVNYRIDENGRLCVSGSSVCKKLIVNGEMTERDEWFNTGDIMKCDTDGRYYVLGRESDLVFGESGEKLNPDIAEEAFDIPFAKEFCVLGDVKNENLVMIVRIPRGLVELQKRQIAAAVEKCNSGLPVDYRVRRVYYTYDELLHSGEIKVSRAQLRRCVANGDVELFGSLTQLDQEEVGEDDVKPIVRKMIAEILGIEEAAVTDTAHFMFDLGGSSLDYLSLISAIDNRFDITMSFEEKDFNYCLGDIVRIVKERICG